MSNKIFDLRLDNIINELSGLRKEELEKLSEHLCNVLSNQRNEDDTVYTFGSDKVKVCKKCGSINVVKFGKDHKGHQKYRCKDCRGMFTSITSTVFAWSKKSAEQWKQFIICTLEGRTLHYCANKCNISYPTSFAWRHKLMNALSSCQFSHSLNGIIEIDEMFVNVSYKGNHKKSKNFTMPRPALKRGTDNKARRAEGRACVLCMAERNKGFSGVVTHRGSLNTEVLEKTLDNRIAIESIVLTDESTCMQKYFSEKPYEHMKLASSVTGAAFKTVPVVNGPYHINNINALHRRFRAFLRQYNGVATKHLNAYLSLFLWIENNINKNRLSPDSTIQQALSSHTHTKSKEIFQKPLLLTA